MDLYQIRNRYLKYFEKKGHVIIPSTSLVPENDPTTLFTGSGMQPLLPYLLGEPHSLGDKLVNSQKCFRAEDIDEVGDNRHTTFFEMLGNWSLGDYFKEEQIAWFFSFLTEDLGLPAEKLYVTVFSGEPKFNLPKDSQSAEIWKKLFASKNIVAKEVEIGTVDNGGKVGMQGGKIFYYGAEKNWWSRSGYPDVMPVGEPGGPDSEVFFEFVEIAHDKKYGEHCHPNCDCGRFMEIGNSVFMEYLKKSDNLFALLPKKNVDFGGGLERIATAVRGDSDIFNVDVFAPVMEKLCVLSGKSYTTANPEDKKDLRVIADHIRAATFMSIDGILPSNKERGYILRRLVRRATLSAQRIGLIGKDWIGEILSSFATSYGNYYTEIEDGKNSIKKVLNEEVSKFNETLAKGLKRFEATASSGSLSAQSIFDLYQTYGFPEELSVEMAKEKNIEIKPEELVLLKNKHRNLSRQSTDKKFKGGLADTGEKSTQYHTATHLLNQALREVLGKHVSQRGSNITAERLRFDFSHPSKLTDEEKQKVEKIVNDKINENLPVTQVKMSLNEALESGVVGVFGERYPEMVTVYSIGNETRGYFSREICGGPHVKNTGELKGKFKILKEEAVSQGVRRVKAVLE